MLRRLMLEEDGQSLVEYGLILGIVSVALITVLGVMKANLYNIFTSVSKSLNQASRAGGK
ncbi:MAG: Flp/Fap pilin component [Cyanobacteria bacterium RYN_339]|nr:Flp/Fap pilin component [Cyanobacteria bacterium RYN_339]